MNSVMPAPHRAARAARCRAARTAGAPEPSRGSTVNDQPSFRACVGGGRTTRSPAASMNVSSSRSSRTVSRGLAARAGVRRSRARRGDVELAARRAAPARSRAAQSSTLGLGASKRVAHLVTANAVGRGGDPQWIAVRAEAASEGAPTVRLRLGGEASRRPSRRGPPRSGPRRSTARRRRGPATLGALVVSTASGSHVDRDGDRRVGRPGCEHVARVQRTVLVPVQDQPMPPAAVARQAGRDRVGHRDRCCRRSAAGSRS